jgi:hypothetical protein
MCVGDYFEANAELPELAPAALAALLMTDHHFPPASLSGGRYLERRVEAALRWLANETPRIPLPDMADQLINEYAWACVQGTAGRSGPAAAAPLPVSA